MHPPPPPADRADREGRHHEPRVVTPPHDPPEAADADLAWQGQQVRARASWTVLRRDESPSAEVFMTTYTLEPGTAPEDRPVTFVFNGGPGASSAFLHLGGVGPRRVAFPDDGSLPPMPARVVDNEDAWLGFTDLVFVDPVGTGFSRMIPPAPRSRWDQDDEEADPGYLTFDRDLASLREAVSRWLSANGRWTSPVFIAGESYGGYRVARLARSLHADEGVGLAGAIMISPAIEITPLTATDYALEPFIDTLPTMAVAALHHARSRVGATDVEALMADAFAFARGPYVQFLAQGSAMPEPQRQAVMAELADMIGLSPDVVEQHRGRIPIGVFVRELLRDEGRVIGLYDTAVVIDDPFPDRQPFSGPDATLHGASAPFTAGANQVLRAEIGLRTERRYDVLNMDVNTGWRADDEHHALSVPPGAADDLRFGLALNPHLKVMVTHGRHDLVTPSHGSVRLVDHLLVGIDPDRVRLHRYDGGHMYYTWADSRRRSTADTAAFYADCLRGR